MSLACLLAPLLLLGVASGYPAEDQITDLPGLDYTINFDHYSGYLNGTEGRKLHYWFTESQNDATTDPLVLWLNGGPGCSSLDGLLTENGPYLVTADGSGLYENIYGWNKNASVLYLESPACVGFSYDENSNCATGDDEVSEMNYLALQNFFIKFPEYRDREFYITGESYAGIYIPTLSVKIVERNADYPINFQGFAIGNGLLSYVSNENSLMFYGYYHALLGQDLWNDLVDRCCGGVESKDTCDFIVQVSALCEVSILMATDIMYYQGLNMYNLYADCESSDVSQSNRYIHDLQNIFINTRIHRPETYSDPPCIDSSAAMNYLNTAETRAAIHIPDGVQDWEICSDPVGSLYSREVYNVSSQLRYLHDNNVRGLIYNGDVDMACNVIGNEWDVEGLQYDIVDSRKKWTVGGQVAGYVKKFELLDFVTVRGSGHMVPQDKPAEAFQMIYAFINNESY